MIGQIHYPVTGVLKGGFAVTSSSQSAVPIACDLSALDADERARRAELGRRVCAQAREVTETPSGYALRLAPEADAPRMAFEWLLLERRCCPFLELELAFEPGPGAVWIRLGGGPGVKEFLAAADLGANGAKESTA